MRDDSQLLREYVETGAEDAFRELVHRHLDLVYAAARRTLADAHLAQDVAQTVFSDLARKAATLPRGTVLAGWLYQSARYSAAKVARGEERRRRRESVALEGDMNDREPDWQVLRALLDEAMEELPAEDRDAVLLRYFQRRELKAVGDALGITDEAARKRVARALERLRVTLSRRGLTTTAGALAATLTAHAAAPAPAGLAASIATISLAGAAAGVAGATAGAATLGTVAFMTKAQVAVISVALLAAGVSGKLAYSAHERAGILEAELNSMKAQQDAEPAPIPPAPASVVRPLDEAEREELLRLRGEVSRLRSQVGTNRVITAPPPFAMRGNRSERKANPNRGAGFLPTEQYTFVGFGSPADALQSHYWAVANPASGKLLETLALPPEVRAVLPRRMGGSAVPVVGKGEDAARIVASADSVEPIDAAELMAEFKGSADRVAVVQTLEAQVAEGVAPDVGSATEDVMASGSIAHLSPYNGHRVIGETEIDPDTRELQVERELADGTTRTENQRVVRVGDEWKVVPGGNVQVLTTPGGGAGVMIRSSEGGAPGARMEMRIERRPAPGSP